VPTLKIIKDARSTETKKTVCAGACPPDRWTATITGAQLRLATDDILLRINATKILAITTASAPTIMEIRIVTQTVTTPGRTMTLRPGNTIRGCLGRQTTAMITTDNPLLTVATIRLRDSATKILG